MSFYFPIPSLNKKTNNSKFDCNKCGLKNNKIDNPVLEIYQGPQYDGLIILGQKVSKEDDEKGKPFADSRSKILRSIAIKFGINLAKQSAMLHAVSCYNPSKKKTSDTHFKCCQSILDARLKELKPKLIICCGEMAFKYLFNLKNKYAISKLRNRIIPNYEYNCLVFPVYDPYNRKMYSKKNGIDELNYYYQHTYKRDLERIFKFWNKIAYKRTEVKKILQERKILEGITITEVKTVKEAKQLFNLWNQCKEIALDYETTNLFPYDHYFEIIYIAFANKQSAWVFHEDFWKKDKKIEIWFHLQMQKLLTNKNICKVIQNSKFEDLASRFIFKIKRIENMFCTMLATHVIDEREGCTSLDFQNLVRFGIPPYNETIKKYLETSKKSIDKEDNDSEEEDNDDVGNYTFEKVNKIREAPKEDMIQYNALDVITTFNNFLLFRKDLFDIYPKAKENYEFLYDGHMLFADMTQRGINIGEQELNEFEKFLDKEIERIEAEIESMPEVIEFNKYLENKTGKTKKKKEEKDLQSLCFEKPKRISLRRR